MKKTLLFLFTIVVTATLSAQTVGDVFVIDNIKYTVTSVGPNEAEVSGFSDLDAAASSITIPTSVTDPGNSTAYNVVNVGLGAFSCNPLSTKGSGDTRNNVLQTVSLPSSVVSLGDHSFRDNPNLTTINMNYLVSTGNNVFPNCTSLSDIGTLSNLTTLGNYTFSACLGLKTIEMPIVESIGTGAISGTSGVYLAGGITSINIPGSVSSIGGIFLGRLWDLTKVQVNWTDPSTVTITETNFFRTLDKSTITIYVPTGTKALYEAHALWGLFPAENIVEGDIPMSYNVEKELDFSIYPNPTNGVVFIKSKQLDNAAVSVYSINGSVLLQKSISGVSSEINLSDFASGIYILQVEVEGGVFTKRIVKK